MLALLLRLLIGLALFAAPVVLFVLASRKPENALYLIFPMFGAPPAVLAALLLFTPLEASLDGSGLSAWKDWAIPLSGSLLIFAVLLAGAAFSRRFGRLISSLREKPSTVLGPAFVWSILGALWGAAWRLSDRLVAMTPFA